MEQTDKPKVVVTREWFKWRIAAIVLLMGGLGAGLVAVQLNQELRGRASGPVVTAQPLVVSSSLPPSTDVQPPYLRLYVPRATYGFAEVVPVAVYLNTNDQPTMETTVVATYDADAVSITDADIEVDDVYKSVTVDASESGKIMLTLFVTPSVGHKPVATNTDTRIATLKFTTKTLESEMLIELPFTRGNSRNTALIPYSQTRTDSAQNILQNIINTQFTIAP